MNDLFGQEKSQRGSSETSQERKEQNERQEQERVGFENSHVSIIKVDYLKRGVINLAWSKLKYYETTGEEESQL